MAPRHSLAAWFAGVMGVLVVYASLYPFGPWAWGAVPPEVAWWRLNWPQWRDRPDEALNVLGYIPLGLCLSVSLWRARLPMTAAAAIAVLACSGLSYSMEVLQTFLPSRVPSSRDWVCNTVGAALGGGLALVGHRGYWWQRRRQLQDRWFQPHSTGALVGLSLWPVSLLFPTPIPFALGQFWAELGAWLGPWLPLVLRPDVSGPPQPLTPLQEAGLVALSLIGPLSLAAAAARHRRYGLVFTVLTGALGVGAMVLSTALNFGPQHAWAGWTPQVALGMASAAAAGLLMVLLPSRVCAMLGLMALVASLAMASALPTDSYFEASLKAWEQGRFVRFHGLSQWVGWLWPYAALMGLFWRVARPPPR